MVLKRRAAPGVDGLAWPDYEAALESNLQGLHARVQRGTYRALPVKRRLIPKQDGTPRPLGITALEDKIVQRAVVTVLGAIYEGDFLGFSYGFRPGRSQHDALDALSVGIGTARVNWILDADIRRYFDKIDQAWLIRMLEHRIGDERVIRLVRKWLVHHRVQATGFQPVSFSSMMRHWRCRHGLQIREPYSLSDRVPLRVGHQVPVQGAYGRGCVAGTGVGEADLRGVRDTDRQRRGECGSRSHTGQCTTELAPSEIMRRIKGRTASRMFEEFAHIKKRFWGRHVWARGYFCATVGQMTEEMIKTYLEHHFELGTSDEFKLDTP